MSTNEINKGESFFNRYRRWFIFLFIIIILSILIWFNSRPKPVAVDIITVNKGLVEQTVANTRAGTVKACQRAKLSPSVGGQITKLPVKEGDFVTTGQLLLSLSNEDLVAQVDLANSEIKSAKNKANSACLQAKFSQREANRLKKLRKSNAVSEERLDDAVTVAKMNASNCKSAQALIAMSKAQRNVAQASLEKTRLLAPFDGIIADISAELSEYVTPSPVGVQTLPVIDLINNSCFYVAAPIDEVDMPAVSVDMPARISLDAFRDDYFQGSVRRIAAYVLDLEKQARTVDVEVKFLSPEDHKKLLAGYSADVEIVIDSESNAIRVPTEVLFDKKSDKKNPKEDSEEESNEKIDTQKVWVYDPELKSIKVRNIKTGLSNWSYTQVVEGLTVGEKIVLSIDREGLADGVTVNATEK